MQGEGTHQELAASPEVLDNIMLCLRPASGEEEGVAWTRYLRLVADIDGVPVSLLTRVLEEALAIERDDKANGQYTG